MPVLARQMLVQEAKSSVALDGETQSFPEPEPELEEPAEPELEEVTIEPDLPQEPEQSVYEKMVADMDPTEPRYVAGRRGPKLRVGDHVLSPGDLVPGAANWPRLESWLMTGQVVKE